MKGRKPERLEKTPDDELQKILSYLILSIP